MMVTHSVEMVLQSYEESLCIEIEKIYINEENILKLLVKEKSLIFWLKSEYHPKVLTDEVIKMIKEYNFLEELKKKNYYPKLVNWIFINKKLVLIICESIDANSEDKSDEILLSNFYNFLNDISNMLDI